MLFSFLNREMPVKEFEKWLYEHDELECCAPLEAYRELLAIDYNGKYAYDVIRKIIDVGACELERIRDLLGDFITDKSGIVELAGRIYREYCKGCYFLEKIANAFITTADYDEEKIYGNRNRLLAQRAELVREARQIIDLMERGAISMTDVREFLEIIPLSKDFLEPATRLLARYMKSSYGRDEELTSKCEKSLLDLLDDGVAQFHLARHGNDWAGFVVVYWGFSTASGRPVLRIQDICVEPLFRNRGIGTRLLQFCEKMASEKGANSIRLETNVGNTAARRLYAKAGFAEFPQRLVCMKFLES
ncbi:MAG: hypothetical protein C6W55_10295 [Thermobacillus sp.]|uniref:GNAT family N-acetyltransferase n=1 Tax=Thermobacillus sp. TaxID=2108467 RepID=UPI000E38AE19|nr:GNAT family N-acetyltransferase [Thermobacillus sp.]REK55366.1 MAG: hypothetical protein C6W55_10295 [Thermobacillus sp.]